jgi:CDP-diacylglycerol--serine O-phosphatidyltransferase
MKKVYLLPNVFTTASLLCGVLALVDVMIGRIVEACWLILLAVVLDGIDGKIARLTRSASGFGLNYDSLSDIVSFGVAPGLLIFTCVEPINLRLAASLSVLYIIFGALRLARFNVQACLEERKVFIGLPIPMAAGTIVSAFLLFQQYQHLTAQRIFMPVLVVGLSYLMVSKIRYPSLKTIKFNKRSAFDYLVSICVIISMIVFLHQFVELLLFIAFSTYVLYGIGLYMAAAIQKKKAESEAEEKESEI